VLRPPVANQLQHIWNSLPNGVASAYSINTFKSRLDKFWKSYDFLYDYKAQHWKSEVVLLIINVSGIVLSFVIIAGKRG